MFKSLLKAAVGTVLLPVDAAADFLTLGGEDILVYVAEGAPWPEDVT
jgi:hypothetical protein